MVSGLKFRHRYKKVYAFLSFQAVNFCLVWKGGSHPGCCREVPVGVSRTRTTVLRCKCQFRPQHVSPAGREAVKIQVLKTFSFNKVFEFSNSTYTSVRATEYGH